MHPNPRRSPVANGRGNWRESSRDSAGEGPEWYELVKPLDRKGLVKGVKDKRTSPQCAQEEQEVALPKDDRMIEKFSASPLQALTTRPLHKYLGES